METISFFSSPLLIMPGMTHPRFSPHLHQQGMIIRSPSLESSLLEPGAAADAAHHIIDPNVNQPGIIGWSPSTGSAPSYVVTARELAPWKQSCLPIEEQLSQWSHSWACPRLPALLLSRDIWQDIHICSCQWKAMEWVRCVENTFLFANLWKANIAVLLHDAKYRR